MPAEPAPRPERPAREEPARAEPAPSTPAAPAKPALTASQRSALELKWAEAPAPAAPGAPARALALLGQAARQPATGPLRPLIERAVDVREALLLGLEADLEREEQLELLADPRWHGIVGARTYAALETALEPALREELGARLRALSALAGRFEAALQTAERAWAEGDLQAVRAAFPLDHEDALDPWFQAARRVLSEPALAAALPAQAQPRAEPLAEVLTVKAGASRPLTSAAPATPVIAWEERCLALVKQLRGTRGAQRAELQVELGEVVAESVQDGARSFEDCARVLAFYEGHPAVEKALPDLAERLASLHQVYFQGAFQRASGPASFQALASWSRAHDHPEWAARVTPFLRLFGPPSRADKERGRRAQALEAAHSFGAERRAQLVEGLRELVGGLEEAGCAPALKDALRGLVARAVPGEDGAALAARLEALPAASDAVQTRLAEGKLKRLVAQVSARLYKAVDTCVDAGEPGLGFDLLQQLLEIDPEHEKARRGLGHVRVDGRWMRRHEAERWAAGVEWLPGAGWIRRADRARWEAGEVADPATGWLARAEADRRHADPRDPWVIETEHFRLRSTAPLARTAQVAERLEAFYLAVFSRLDLFFAERGGAALVFGVSATPRRHEVWFYRDREQYLAHSQAPAKTAGVYDPARRCAFFYDEGEDWSTLQHELTHEILDETSPGLAGQHAWLVEGTAAYLQDAQLRGGAIVLPPLPERTYVVRHAQALRGEPGGAIKVGQLVRLDQGAWNQVSTHEHYAAAGALVYFLCHADGGRYRGDLVRMLKDTYHGRQVSLPEATGLSLEAIQALEEHFFAAR